MPVRFNASTLLRAVQFDYERAPRPRLVRLSAPTDVVGDPVRIRMAGVEVEARIVEATGPMLRVNLKATPLRQVGPNGFGEHDRSSNSL
jgi:hypothetical protein